MSTTVYGIKNCDTMKKAFAWLDEHGVAYTFHDYKKSGIDSARLHAWSKAVGWKTLLNTRGTTWRRLSDDERASAADPDGARRLMARQPTLIKRPLIEAGETLLVGFDPARYAEVFAVPTIPPTAAGA